jgi:hypothetical protein
MANMPYSLMGKVPLDIFLLRLRINFAKCTISIGYKEMLEMRSTGIFGRLL